MRSLLGDPALAPVAGDWHVLHIQAGWGSGAPQDNIIVQLGFDAPAMLTWTETDLGCTDDHGQLELFSVHAPDLTGLMAIVSLTGQPSICLAHPQLAPPSP